MNAQLFSLKLIGQKLLMILPLALCACSLAPHYERPTLMADAKDNETITPTFKESVWIETTPSAVDARQIKAWWAMFHDDTLNQLAEKINHNNNLQQSKAQWESALAAVSGVAADRYPTINLSGGATNSKTGDARVVKTQNAQLGVSSWELDLWHRIGDQTDAASLNADALHDTLLATRLSLQASLVQNYFGLRAAEAQMEALQNTVASNEKNLKIIQNRYEAGVVAKSDVLQAKSQWQSAQSNLLAAITKRAQYEHAIAVLVGAFPATFNINYRPELFLAYQDAVSLPSLMPSTVLLKRPDIAAAERKVAAANAKIGAARAAYFPAMTLSAQAGYKQSTSTDLVNLITAPFRFWSWGPSLALSLFDFGAKSSAVDSAQADFTAAVANYRQTALTAMQEIEDNLIAAAHLAKQSQIGADGLSDAKKLAEITQNQYDAGIVGYLNVLTAQNTAQNTEINLINTQLQYLTAVNQLLKNAAGDWQE